MRSTRMRWRFFFKKTARSRLRWLELEGSSDRSIDEEKVLDDEEVVEGKSLLEIGSKPSVRR